MTERVSDDLLPTASLDIQVLNRTTHERNVATRIVLGRTSCCPYASIGANAVMNLLQSSKI